MCLRRVDHKQEQKLFFFYHTFFFGPSLPSQARGHWPRTKDERGNPVHLASHGDAWVRAGQDLAAPDTWSNSQLQALATAHAKLIQEYKCAEQHAAPADPAADQVPQAPTPLLIPPLNQLAQLRAARAHGENAENAQDEDIQGPRMPDQRKITAAIMKAWPPHIAARALGADPRGKIMHACSRRPSHAYRGR